MAKPKGLGRGLDALLAARKRADDALDRIWRVGDAAARARYQPRTRMDRESLAELAESIKAQGVMQPILVRPVEAAGTRSSPASGAGAPRSSPG